MYVLCMFLAEMRSTSDGVRSLDKRGNPAWRSLRSYVGGTSVHSSARLAESAVTQAVCRLANNGGALGVTQKKALGNRG